MPSFQDVHDGCAKSVAADELLISCRESGAIVVYCSFCSGILCCKRLRSRERVEVTFLAVS